MPDRKLDPTQFLDPTIAKLENALLARAATLEGNSEAPGLNRVIAAEFRELAKELHHW